MEGGFVLPPMEGGALQSQEARLIQDEARITQEEHDTRRLKHIVYPSLAAFILLASYFFYLVYSLSKDIHSMASDMVTLTAIVEDNVKVWIDVADNMDAVASYMKLMEPMAATMASMDQSTTKMVEIAADMDTMRMRLDTISETIGVMPSLASDIGTIANQMNTISEEMGALGPMAGHVAEMQRANANMAWNMHLMQRNVNGISRNVSPKGMMPWNFF